MWAIKHSWGKEGNAFSKNFFFLLFYAFIFLYNFKIILFVNRPNCAQNLFALKLEVIRFTNGVLKNSSFPEIFSQRMSPLPAVTELLGILPKSKENTVF